MSPSPSMSQSYWNGEEPPVRDRLILPDVSPKQLMELILANKFKLLGCVISIRVSF